MAPKSRSSVISAIRRGARTPERQLAILACTFRCIFAGFVKSHLRDQLIRHNETAPMLALKSISRDANVQTSLVCGKRPRHVTMIAVDDDIATAFSSTQAQSNRRQTFPAGKFKDIFGLHHAVFQHSRCAVRVRSNKFDFKVPRCEFYHRRDREMAGLPSAVIIQTIDLPIVERCRFHQLLGCRGCGGIAPFLGRIGRFDFGAFQDCYSIIARSGLTVQPDQIAAETSKSLGEFLHILSSVSSAAIMNPDVEQEIARKKWRLAKRAQRARKRPVPLSVCPVFREAVFDERDRRSRSAYWARQVINGIYVDVAGRLGGFASDVWAAREMLRAEWGAGADTPTRIAQWLWDEGLAGDYAKSSLRPRVYAAIKIIEDLERHGNTPLDSPFWEPWQFTFERERAQDGGD